MKIGLDFDGVIADCAKLKVQAAQKIWGVDIPVHRFKREFIVQDGIATHEQYDIFLEKVFVSPEFSLDMDPVPHALDYIHKILSLGHEVRVITSRSGPALERAQEWSKKFNLDLHFTGVGYKQSKAPACEGLDIYVDDDIDKLEELLSIVPQRLLLSWDYNQHIPNSNSAQRIDSWHEIYNFIISNSPHGKSR
jgi:hypothetical protein